MIFVYENENILDDRIWLRADGSQTYAVGFFPEVADVFERAQIDTVVKDNFPPLTAVDLPSPYSAYAFGADETTESIGDGNHQPFKAFNKSNATDNDS